MKRSVCKKIVFSFSMFLSLQVSASSEFESLVKFLKENMIAVQAGLDAMNPLKSCPHGTIISNDLWGSVFVIKEDGTTILKDEKGKKIVFKKNRIILDGRIFEKGEKKLFTYDLNYERELYPAVFHVDNRGSIGVLFNSKLSTVNYDKTDLLLQVDENLNVYRLN